MSKYGLKLRTTLEALPQISADTWQLYTATPELREECIYAARELCIALRDAVNEGKDRYGVSRAVAKVQNEFRHTGAFDSEPNWVLEDLLDEIFGEE